MTLKFQSGGTLPFTEYLPFIGGADDSDANVPLVGDKEAKAKEADSSAKADIFKLLNGLKGLPSDTGKLISDLQSIYSEASLYNNGELDSSSLVTTYLSTLQKMKTAEFNEGQYKSAKETVEENDGLHEYAIDSSGRVVVQSQKDGKIKHMTLDQFYDQGDDPEYLPLTNSNLLYYRAQDPSFAFKNDLLDVVSNGIGQAKVTEMIQKALSGIGSDTLQNQGYTAKQSDNITKGISILSDLIKEGKTQDQIWGDNGLLSLDGIYKTNSLTSDQKGYIEDAARYLWQTMPKNAQTWLAIRSNNTDDPMKGAYDLMLTLMLSNNTHRQQFSADLQEKLQLNADGSISSGDAGDDKSKLRIGWLQHVQAGDGGRVATMHVNLGGDNSAVGMSVTGSGYGMAVTPDGKAIGQTSMYNMVESSRLKGIAQGFYFGEQKMSLNDLNYIAYTGEELLRVNLPVKSDGSPDFNLLREYNQAYQEFLMTNQTKEDEKRIFGSKPELANLTNADGTLNMSRFAPFVLVNGITTDKLANLDPKTNEYIAEQKADPRLYQQIKQSLATGTESKPIYPDIDEYGWSEAPFQSWGEWLNSYDHIYEGVLYIPISMNRNASAMYENQKLPQNEQDNLEIEYQQNPAFLNFDTGGNSVDFLRN